MAATLLGEKILSENGAQNAVNSFYRHLPLKDMICDVSIGMGEFKLAQVKKFKFESYFILN